MRRIIPAVTWKWCHKVWSFHLQTGLTSCCYRVTIRARQDMLTDGIAHTNSHKQHPRTRTLCKHINTHKQQRTRWHALSCAQLCTRVHTPCALHHTCMSVIATYHQGFHSSTRFSHSPPSTKQPLSSTMPENVSIKCTKPPCVHHFISHNDLTQVSIVTNCDTLHSLSTAFCLA